MRRQARRAGLPAQLRLSLVITTTRSRRMVEEKSWAHEMSEQQSMGMSECTGLAYERREIANLEKRLSNNLIRTIYSNFLGYQGIISRPQRIF